MEILPEKPSFGLPYVPAPVYANWR